jgi:hypothetical protein
MARSYRRAQARGAAAPPTEAEIRAAAQIGGRGMKDPRRPEWAYQAVEYLKLKWRHIDANHEQFLDMVA